MNELFLQGSVLGTLYYEDVYEYFDEPRFFSVSNSVGTKYLSYWLGSDDVKDKWLVFPVSSERLEALETRQRCIRDTLLYQEENIAYIFDVLYGELEPYTFTFFKSEEISENIKLPKPGLYVSESPTTNAVAPQVKQVINSHELHIDKVSRKAKPLVVEQIATLLNSFSNFYGSLAASLDISSILRPTQYRNGSFILSLNLESFDALEKDLIKLFDLISQKEDIKSFVIDKGIDAAFLLDLFYNVSDSKSVLDFKNNSTGRSVLKLSATGAKYYIEDQEFIHLADSSIRSSQVPQANDLDKLFEVLAKKSAGIYISPTEVSLTERQIDYYLHAASTLGFVNENDTITALGRKVAESDHETRLRLTAECFQLSDCAQAWTAWAKVNSLTELDPKSASRFLIEACNSLSESTSKRRASTLEKWYSMLHEYFPKELNQQ